MISLDLETLELRNQSEQTMAYDVFISYKNDSSGNIFAERLANDLKEMGYGVYFNSHERRSGMFDERIRSAIASCKDFIAIVSKGYLSQLLDPKPEGSDWIRLELLEAHRHEGIAITPVYLTGVTEPQEEDFGDADEAAFFANLDGVEMPGDAYDVSPLEMLTNRLSSRREGCLDYRDVANGNPSLSANEVLRDAYKAATQGDYGAMTRIGLMMFYGICEQLGGGAVRDFAEAMRWFSRVSEECSSDELRSIADMFIARMYYQGEGIASGPDYKMSFEYHKRSDAIPYSAAQTAFMMKMGLGCPYDFHAIEAYYQRMIDEGDMIAKLELGRFYESHGMFAKAEQTFLSMKPISPDAHYSLGMLYARGNHVSPAKPSYEKASYHFQLAAERGNVAAMVELGHLFFRPITGFTRDFHKAMSCYQMAAEAGNASAQYMMGYMYEFGHIERNIPEAIRYFELAAAQGSILSSTHLGLLYQLPEQCNYGLAFKNCAVAADAGESTAEFMLANMLLFGRGCRYDIDRAKRYYLRALQHGFVPAQQMLDVLMEKAGAIETGEMPTWLKYVAD